MSAKQSTDLLYMSMSTPIILLCGQAGSGKDTVAKIIASYQETSIVALADPFKRFALDVFEFTPESLWGASEHRNKGNPRFMDEDAWGKAYHRMASRSTLWLGDVNPDGNNRFAYTVLLGCFIKLAEEHGFAMIPKNAMDEQTRLMKVSTGHPPLTVRATLQKLGSEFGRAVDPQIWADYAVDMALELLAQGTYSYDQVKGITKDPRKPVEMVVISDGRFRNEILGVKKAGGYVIRIKDPHAPPPSSTAHASETSLNAIPDHFYDAVLINDKKRGTLFLENEVFRMLKSLRKTAVYGDY